MTLSQLYNTDLLHVQQYLFTKLKIEPTSRVKVEYNGSRLLEISKIDDEDDVKGMYEGQPTKPKIQAERYNIS